jgi:hypothetical protein
MAVDFQKVSIYFDAADFEEVAPPSGVVINGNSYSVADPTAPIFLKGQWVSSTKDATTTCNQRVYWAAGRI